MLGDFMSCYFAGPQQGHSFQDFFFWENISLGLRLGLDSKACSFENENAINNLEIRQGLPVKPMLALNSASPCLSLLNAGMIGMH